MRPKAEQGERFLPLILLTLLSLSTYSYADEVQVQPYLIFDSFSHSETVSLEATAHSWKGGDSQPGQQQWTWNWIELGVQRQHWAIGVQQRYDYDLQFSADTAELYWLAENKKDLPVNKQYDLDLQVNTFHSTGIRFSYFDKLSTPFSYRVGLAYLRANYMLDGGLAGSATALNQSDYDFQATVDYHYTEDPLFERIVNEPTGHGFALDFEFGYQITAATHWQIQVRDLLAKLYWQDLPYTQGNSTSDRKEYDENGYVSINPVLQGFEGTSNGYVQTLKPRWYSKINHVLTPNYAVVLQYRQQFGRGSFAVGLDHKLTHDTHLGLNYWPTNKSLELNWNYQKVQLAVVADGLSASKMRTFWLSLSYGL